MTGWVVATIVLLALYFLAATFACKSFPPSTRKKSMNITALKVIPNAVLFAVIIHAILDVIASPNTVYGFWKVSPVEACIWLASALVAVVHNFFLVLTAGC